MLETKMSRNSTLELLRIISMIMVIGLHYMNESIGGGLNVEEKFNVISSHIIESICISSVNVYVLISGFFLQKTKKTGLRKALDLYLVMLFYDILCFGISVATKQYDFSLRELIFAIVPFFRGHKWFLETYIILLLFSPFINKMLDGCNKKSHLFLIVIQLLIFSIWPSFFPSAPITDAGYGIINFLTLFFISGFIKRYVLFSNYRRNRLVFFAIYCFACIAIAISSFIPYLSSRAWDYCYIFNIIASVSIFAFFLNCPVLNNRIVNRIASTTFGVYISHVMLYFQPLIYHGLLHTELYYDSPWQPVHFFVSVVFLFVICSLIDLIRQEIWKRTISVAFKNSKLIKKEEIWEDTFL